MQSNKIFRQAALDRLASPEQLHTLMRVTDPKGWLALAGSALVVLAALVWAIFGRIQTKLSASGILLHGGAIVELSAQGDGQISSIEIEAGKDVAAGQVVARIAQPGLAQQIDGLKRRIDEIAPDAVAGSMGPYQADRRKRLQEDLERLERQLQDTSIVVSGFDGRIVELRAVAGDRVVAGTPIVALERMGQHAALEALLYFDSHQGKAVKPGMTIEIVPSVVRKERDGVLLGRVKAVEDFPSTRLGMMGALRNEQLVDSLIQEAGGAPIAVRAEIITDPRTPTGYRWSTGKGPDLILTSGTRCAAAVITRTQRPIALVFPALDYGG